MSDLRHHLDSLFMKESLLDKDLERATANPYVTRMLPDAAVVKIGGRSIIDRGREAVIPLVEVLAQTMESTKLILGTGGGARSRHVFSIGIDLGMPTGVLAELAQADALGNAHILGTLLAPHGVVAVPPEIFGHLLPMFIRAVPGVIFTGVPPYSLWEHPPEIGRIPPHGSDAGCFLLAECFGCKSLVLVKDVDGLCERDPRKNPDAAFIPKISVSELKEASFDSLPFERCLVDLLQHAKNLRSFQIVNGTKPDKVREALQGKAVGTIVYAD